jgi:hypothetical protein
MTHRTYTFHWPCDDSSAVEIEREFEAFAARLAEKHGRKLKADRRLMGNVFVFSPYYKRSSVTPLRPTAPAAPMLPGVA